MLTRKNIDFSRHYHLFFMSVIVFLLVMTGMSSKVMAGDTLPIEGQGEKGENQPYAHGYRVLDILNWSPETDLNAAYLKASVPLQERNDAFMATQANPSLSPDTQMLNLAGDYGNAFFESYQANDNFDSLLHNYWQYTDIFASWHGLPTSEVPEELYDPEADWTERHFEFGILNLPNPAYTNAAHKNGTLSLGTIFLPREGQTHSDLLIKNDSNEFPVAKKLVEMAEFYGFDGYFINQETDISPTEVSLYKEFMQAMREKGLYIQWYDSVTDPSGKIDYQNEFNQSNSPFVKDNLMGRVSDSIFLNYWWNEQRIENSKQHAESLGLNPLYTVFTGVEAGMYKYNQPYNLRDILDSQGNPKTAIATLGSEFVLGELDADTGLGRTENDNQYKVFERERLWWSGPNQDPTNATRNDDYPNWDGIASYIAERSVINGTSFVTNFNTGHGLKYYQNGEVANKEEWSNINLQDILPTWQWWFENNSGKETTLKVDFDYGKDYVSGENFDYKTVGGYKGGSSLVIEGDLQEDQFLRLYKTDLDITKGSSFDITYQKSSNDEGTLKAGFIFKDKPEEIVYKEIPHSDKQKDKWITQKVNLKDEAGRELAAFGLGFSPGKESTKDYQINIGEIKLSDGKKTKPDKPTNFQLEKAYDTNEMKVSWDLNDYDEVRKYHLYAKLSNGNTVFLGGTYDDHYYIKSLYGESKHATLLLKAVGPDGTESSPAKLTHDFQKEISDLQVREEDAFLKVKWKQRSGSVKTAVTLTKGSGDRDDGQIYYADKGIDELQIPIDDPDGSRYELTVKPLKSKAHGITHSGRLNDAVPSRYTGGFHVKDSVLSLDTPTPEDWHHLYLYVNGELVQHEMPHSNEVSDYLIRGTHPLKQLATVASGDQVEVVLEDYSGNKSESVSYTVGK